MPGADGDSDDEVLSVKGQEVGLVFGVVGSEFEGVRVDEEAFDSDFFGVNASGDDFFMEFSGVDGIVAKENEGRVGDSGVHRVAGDFDDGECHILSAAREKRSGDMDSVDNLVVDDAPGEGSGGWEVDERDRECFISRFR